MRLHGLGGDEQLRKHPTDAVSLVLGLLLMAVGGLYLLTDLSTRSIDLRWVAPAVLIGIAVIGLTGSVRRRDPGQLHDPPPAAPDSATGWMARWLPLRPPAVAVG